MPSEKHCPKCETVPVNQDLEKCPVCGTSLKEQETSSKKKESKKEPKKELKKDSK